MRIISGRARGIRLAVPEDDAIRPTEDKVKESLFSTLGPLEGAAVLDLFSGTGALGLEALSRGAARVVMVERDARHVAVIERNLAAVLKSMGGTASAGEAVVVTGEVAGCAARVSGPFDFVLADPPYHPAAGEYGARELLLDAALARALFTEGTILALEHATDVRGLPWAPSSPWRLLKERSFGIRTVSYARHQSGNPKASTMEE
jgi:16S rRNA (guanine966-N2)-methyltransferase